MTREMDFHGERAYVLRAPDGTSATIVPSIGANCVALRVPSPGGRVGGSSVAHLLSTPPSAAALRGHPTGAGFPILSPHPSGGRAPFTWRGRAYRPPGGDRLAGHGFAAGANWAVLDAAETALVCRLDSRSLDPAAWWPWPYVITATHRVAPGELSLTLAIENMADEPAPLMCGLHPYFPLRFASPRATDDGGVEETDRALPVAADLVGGNEAAVRRSCRVWVDAGTLWERDRSGATGSFRQVGDDWDVRRPRSLTDLADRAVRRGVASPDGRMPVLLYVDRAALAEASAPGDDPAAPGGVASGVVDTAGGLALTLATSRAFGALALYTPPAHAAVSLEPRSALPDALALATDDPHLATGLRAVAPGTPWQAWARLSLAPYQPV